MHHVLSLPFCALSAITRILPVDTTCVNKALHVASCRIYSWVFGEAKAPERDRVRQNKEYQEMLHKPETLFGHVFGNLSGFMAAFSARQARLEDPSGGARPNELTDTRQRFFKY